jgi:hypothetical protein
MSRERALALLEEPTFDPEAMEQDRTFFIKKLDLTSESFEQMLKQPIKSYRDYPNHGNIFHINDRNRYVRVFRAIRSMRGSAA